MENSRFEEAYNEYRKQGLDNSHRESELSGLNNGNGERVEYVRKNDDGDIIAFKTSKNRELDYLQALEEIRKGNLLGLDVFHKYGRDIIRSEPDGIQENNLDNLPEF